MITSIAKSLAPLPTSESAFENALLTMYRLHVSISNNHFPRRFNNSLKKSQTDLFTFGPSKLIINTLSIDKLLNESFKYFTIILEASK